MEKAKSSATEVTTVGSDTNKCPLQTNAGLTTVTWPWIPGGYTVLLEDLVEAGIEPGPVATPIMEGSRTDLLRWLSTTTDPANCAPSIVSIEAPAFQNAYDQAKATGSPRRSRASIDHTFEKNWLMGFLAQIIDPSAPSISTLKEKDIVGKINCADLHDYFFGPQRTRNGMGDLFNAMPGGNENFLSLAGISTGMNEGSKVMYLNRLVLELTVAHALTP